MREQRIVFSESCPDPIQVGPGKHWIVGSMTALRPLSPTLVWLYRQDEEGWHLAQEMPAKEAEELRTILNEWHSKRKGGHDGQKD